MSNRRKTRPRLIPLRGGLPPGAELRSVRILNAAGVDVAGELFGIPPELRAGPRAPAPGPARASVVPRHNELGMS